MTSQYIYWKITIRMLEITNMMVNTNIGMNLDKAKVICLNSDFKLI